jgi:hypothetical protein
MAQYELVPKQFHGFSIYKERLYAPFEINVDGGGR